MTRKTRYQGAIKRGDSVLLIRHREHNGGRSYWLLPGGGIEAGEDEEECVRRELWEETGLEVQVERLLFVEGAFDDGPYRQFKTYLCTAEGEPNPGYEPEAEASAVYGIDAVRWFDLRKPEEWDPTIHQDPITSQVMQRIRTALGYRD